MKSKHILKPVALATLALGAGFLQWNADDIPLQAPAWIDAFGILLIPYFVLAYVVLGAAFGRYWASAPLLMCALPLYFAGSLTDRGDNDGLWVLIYPMIVFVTICIGEPLAGFGYWIRKRYDHH